MTKCALMLATAYTMAGQELLRHDIIDEQWIPTKNADPALITFWNDIAGILHNSTQYRIRSATSEANKIIATIPEFDQSGNQMLIALHLFSFWIDECANWMMRATLKNRTSALKIKVIDKVRTHAGQTIVESSFSAADNIRRRLSGRAVLDIETRHLATKMLKRIIGVMDERKV